MRRPCVTAGLVAAATVALTTACAVPPREHHATLTFERLPPQPLTVRVPADRAGDLDRYVQITEAAGRRLGEWFGPLPTDMLTIEDQGWHDQASHVARDRVRLGTRWISPARGGSLEARLTVALARRHWQVAEVPASTDLREGLALYSAMKILDEHYPDHHAYEARFLGGSAPFAVRSVPVQGPRARLAQLDATPEATRTALALVTLERLIGWGAMQQSLFELAGSDTAADSDVVARFTATVNAVSGRDLGWFIGQALSTSTTFDYGIDRFETAPLEPGSSRYATTVVVRRLGTATFGPVETDPLSTVDRGPLEIRVVFGDGHDIREAWNGRTDTVTLEYESAAPAETAVIDPDAVLMLDADPTNNRRSIATAPAHTGLWVWRWAVWMQDAILTWG